MALIAVAAFAVANNWWFLRSGGPAPSSPIVVVKSGRWDGTAWQLVAYRSDTDGLCYAFAFAGASSEGATMACDTIEGVPRTACRHAGSGRVSPDHRRS